MPDSLKKFDLIIFDCDGVLVDSEPLSQKIMAQLTTRWGKPCTPNQAKEIFLGRTMTECLRILREDLKLSVPDTFLEIYHKDLKTLFEKELQPMPGIKRILKMWPHKKCVASNGSHQKMNLSLGLTGLKDCFDHIFSAEDVAKPKPHPDLFLFAAKNMKAQALKTLVIEDSPLGVKAAKSAQMQVWGFARDTDPQKLKQAGADWVFDDMLQLKDRLGV